MICTYVQTPNNHRIYNIYMYIQFGIAPHRAHGILTLFVPVTCDSPNTLCLISVICCSDLHRLSSALLLESRAPADWLLPINLYNKCINFGTQNKKSNKTKLKCRRKIGVGISIFSTQMEESHTHILQTKPGCDER